MADVKRWTREQEQAITLDGNLLVSAAAGAGKTAVLTERIVRIIGEGTKVDELLVVTFTNLAANEMKERIEKRLTELALEERDEKKRLLLLNAAAGVFRANISTIHAFCKNVLKRNYHKVGLDPAFRIADDAEAETLKKRAIDEAMEAFFVSAEENKDDASLFIIEALNRGDTLEGIIRSIYSFIIARPDPIGFMSRAAEKYNTDFKTAFSLATRQFLILAQRETGILLERAQELYISDLGAEKAEKIKQMLAKDMEVLVGLRQLESYEGYYTALDGLKLDRAVSALPDEVKRFRDDLKALLKKLGGVFVLSMDEERELSHCLYPVVVKLFDITADFMTRYSDYKLAEALVDFNDLEQLALEALADDETAEEYKNKFRYIFVDEYQDTNLVQDKIVSLISRGNNIFMVGDVKQSIYRFRQAEPEVFLEKYRTYDGTVGTRIDLNANFRSETAVLNATNKLFYQLMRGEVGEIDYKDNAELVSREGAGSGGAELQLIELTDESYKAVLKQSAPSGMENADNEQDEEDKEALELEKIEAEGEFIADKIMELISTGSVCDKESGEMRKPRFSDFAVLLRVTKGLALRLVNVLSSRGIPASAELGDGYFEAIEVQVFINLLRIIDNIRQDIPLASVLRSPIGGFTDAELAEIKSGFEGEAFADRLRACAAQREEKEQTELNKKAAGFIEKIERWRRLSRLVSVEETVGRLIDETHFGIYMSALKNGNIRSANIDMLLERAEAFTHGGGRSLYGFILALDSLRANGKLGAAQENNVDAVRIMSIHKSKGLEFPIVFVCALTSEFSGSNLKSVAAVDRDLGMGLRLKTGFYRLKRLDPAIAKRGGKSVIRRAIEAKEENKRTAEEMRVLYVAMTRARERLYLVAAKKKMADYVKKNAAALTDSRVMGAKCFLDWILGAYFPLGLNLNTACTGVGVPIGSDTIYAYYSRAHSSGGEEKGLTRAELRAWLQNAQNADHAAIDEALSFDYPFAQETSIPAKTGVTEQLEGQYEYVPAVPIFMRETKPLSAAERGTATHRFIMLAELGAFDRAELEARLNSFTARGLFTEEEAGAVDLDSVERLFASELYSRILKAEKVYREQEFSIISENGALIQGIVDCFFVEDGCAVIVDYKTTRTKGRSAIEVARSYSPQLEAYKRAVETLTGLPVKEKWVYLLSANEAYMI